jgi:threonylcarbamoyladenosine tRNA methylthiotransferase MtaB
VKVNFQSLGCRLNEAELEYWSSDFVRRGHQLTKESGDADLVVFNSCSVTGEADRKSRKLINRIHKANPQTRLVVTGCYASLQQEAVKQQLGVDLVVVNEDKDNLVHRVLEHFDLPVTTDNSIDKHSLFARGRHRAFIKVQDGCRYRCTFCIVTLARGEERSRQHKDIIDDINHQHQHGVQEVVITGVHVGGYGSDNGSSLYELLSEILDKTRIPRIRLASVEPWDLPANFFDLFRDTRLMPHMHLPLQSGCDTVLRRMARRCKTNEFAEIVDKARSSVPFFNITTDLIVGFPGETEHEWTDTVEFVRQVGFGDMHIFSYSPREGTKAARLPDQVSSEIKKNRSRQMHDLAGELKKQAFTAVLGQADEVLWERRVSGGLLNHWSGYTTHYHKIQASLPGRKHSGCSTVQIQDLVENDLILAGKAISIGAQMKSSMAG